MRPAVDLPRLAEFSDGTAAGLQTLGEIFLTDIAETIDALADAVAGHRAADIELLAHRAGGASAACGATRLSELLLALEVLGRGGNVAESGPLMREVADELARVTGFLRTCLDGGGESHEADPDRR